MNKTYTEEVKEIAYLIGQFYLTENDNDYEATTKKIQRLRINDIEILDKVVNIELSCPSIIIGKRGEDVLKLEEYLKTHGYAKLTITETKQHIEDFLIPVDYSDLESL